MASFQVLLSGLRRAEQQIEAQLAGVRAAISSLAGSVAGKRGRKGIIIVGGKKRRKMSAAARKAISDAQKKRWAKQKADKK